MSDPHGADDAAVAETLKQLLRFEKKRYLEARREAGGTAEGFRKRIRNMYAREKLKFDSLMLDALMEATTKQWQEKPRNKGPDLFSIGGHTVPEYLTRPANGYVSGDDIEEDDEVKYEKVDAAFATVNDLFDDATIKLRKAAQASTAAELEMRAADEARRRARGSMSAFLRDIADGRDR
jgi:hypothetical protein